MTMIRSIAAVLLCALLLAGCAGQPTTPRVGPLGATAPAAEELGVQTEYDYLNELRQQPPPAVPTERCRANPGRRVIEFQNLLSTTDGMIWLDFGMRLRVRVPGIQIPGLPGPLWKPTSDEFVPFRLRPGDFTDTHGRPLSGVQVQDKRLDRRTVDSEVGLITTGVVVVPARHPVICWQINGRVQERLRYFGSDLYVKIAHTNAERFVWITEGKGMYVAFNGNWQVIGIR